MRGQQDIPGNALGAPGWVPAGAQLWLLWGVPPQGPWRLLAAIHPLPAMAPSPRRCGPPLPRWRRLQPPALPRGPGSGGHPDHHPEE